MSSSAEVLALFLEERVEAAVIEEAAVVPALRFAAALAGMVEKNDGLWGLSCRVAAAVTLAVVLANNEDGNFLKKTDFDSVNLGDLTAIRSIEGGSREV